MIKQDFETLDYFQANEIIATGAKLKDVQYELLFFLDRLRKKLGKPIYLCKNGLTTGMHKNKLHYEGLAADFSIANKNTDVNLIFKACMETGFKGMGIYYSQNTKNYSFHIDRGKDYRFWTGYKKKGDRDWFYGNLIIDPKIYNGG